MKLYRIKNQKNYYFPSNHLGKFIKAKYLLESEEKFITIGEIEIWSEQPCEGQVHIFSKKNLDIREVKPPFTFSINYLNRPACTTEFVQLELEEIDPESLLTSENQLLRIIVKGLMFDQQT